jgi:ureidoacrylate peracid hydrolase
MAESAPETTTNSVLLPENIDKITRRDGVPHSVTDYDPGSTALMVIDMQNFYMVEGKMAFCPPALEIVPTVNRLVGAMRGHGSKIIWVRNITNNEAFTTWSTHYRRMKPEIIDVRKRDLAKNSDGFKLWPELDTRKDDLRVNKTRYSAFIDGASNITNVLETHGIDTLVFCGIVTNVCVESTARDAMMLNYRTLIVEDACAANTLSAHTETLNVFYTNFGDVQRTDEVIGCLGGHKAAAAE